MTYFSKWITPGTYTRILSVFGRSRLPQSLRQNSFILKAESKNEKYIFQMLLLQLSIPHVTRYILGNCIQELFAVVSVH